MNAMPSLIDDLQPPQDDAAPGAKAPKGPSPVARFKSAWAARMADPKKKAQTKKAGIAGGIVLAIGLSVGGYFLFRPTPKPDYLKARLDSVFNYTLLTDEFNNLPVEERLRLISQLVERLKGMSAEDSLLMGAFAAGIAGKAREQIEENVSRLAIDVWDKYAKDYGAVPEGEREEYLENAFVDFTKMMEGVAGQTRDISDEERLAEGKRQAERDKRAMSDPNRQPGGEALGRFFSFMNNNVGSHATPQQRMRGQLMMRDMVRYFRDPG